MVTVGPLKDLRVLEIAGIGPSPHAAMILADLDATVLRIERPGGAAGRAYPELRSHGRRGRPALELDLKCPADVERVLELSRHADVFMEGMRPGVAERLGIGPDVVRRLNPRVVYARMTGWGQDGPLAGMVGHDINYLSVTGVLNAVGPTDRPIPPLNLVGDYGGGSTFLVMAILAALVERERSGLGQTVDVAMLDGIGVLAQQILGMASAGEWHEEREANLLDGGCPYYRTYRCADGRYVAVGAIEPSFYAELVKGLGLGDVALPDRESRAEWKGLAAIFADAFSQRSRDAWAAHFRDIDACVTPVLTFAEAADHEQVAARRAIVRRGAEVVSGCGPKFSRSATEPQRAEPSLDEILAGWRGD